MSFSEQIQRRGGLSAEQALDLRAFIVEASERLHAEPSVFSMRVQSLSEELANQGLDLDNLLGIVQQVAKGSLDATKQAAFEADCETYIMRDASIAEFTSLLSANYPELQMILEQLVEAIQEEDRTLMAMAGGTSGRSAGTTKTTKKQKRASIAIESIYGIAAVATAGVVIYKKRSQPKSKNEVAGDDKKEAVMGAESEASSLAKTIPDPAGGSDLPFSQRNLNWNDLGRDLAKAKSLGLDPATIERLRPLQKEFNFGQDAINLNPDIPGSTGSIRSYITAIDSAGKEHKIAITHDITTLNVPKDWTFIKDAPLTPSKQKEPLHRYVSGLSGKDPTWDRLKNASKSLASEMNVDPRRLSHRIISDPLISDRNVVAPGRNSQQIPKSMSSLLDQELSNSGEVVERALQNAADDMGGDLARDMDEFTEDEVKLEIDAVNNAESDVI